MACAAACAALWEGGRAGGAQVGHLAPVPFERLSHRAISELGRAALAVRPEGWLHAETDHFVFHYFSSGIGTPVAIEAEFYYRVYVSELNRDASRWERKCHVFVFERGEDWDLFKVGARLDPWTGGVHRSGELFVVRLADWRFKGHALGHEVAHLVTERFFGAGVPLWLNEGWAEYASARAYASFYRARGYLARPKSKAVAPGDFIPLAELAEMVTYPPGGGALEAFYSESERLVRYLCARDKARFLRLFAELAEGRRFESALSQVYGVMFSGVSGLEAQFREYARGE